VDARYEGRPGSGAEPPASDFGLPTALSSSASTLPAPSRAAASAATTRSQLRSGGCNLVPAARGRGLGRQILAALEEKARKLGYELVRLETGNLQPEAIALYTSSGFRPIPRYGPYVDDDRSVCFEKCLR
jgi:GNAT superfamily N-acetyltransferase